VKGAKSASDNAVALFKTAATVRSPSSPTKPFRDIYLWVNIIIPGWNTGGACEGEGDGIRLAWHAFDWLQASVPGLLARRTTSRPFPCEDLALAPAVR